MYSIIQQLTIIIVIVLLFHIHNNGVNSIGTSTTTTSPSAKHDDNNTNNDCEKNLIACLSELPSNIEINKVLKTCQIEKDSCQKELNTCQQQQQIFTTNQSSSSIPATNTNTCDETTFQNTIKQLRSESKTLLDNLYSAINSSEECKIKLQSCQVDFKSNMSKCEGQQQNQLQTTLGKIEQLENELSSQKITVSQLKQQQEEAKKQKMNENDQCLTKNKQLEMDVNTIRTANVQLKTQEQELRDELDKRAKMFGFYLDKCDENRRKLMWTIENLQIQLEVEKTRSFMSRIMNWVYQDLYMGLKQYISVMVKQLQDDWQKTGKPWVKSYVKNFKSEIYQIFTNIYQWCNNVVGSGIHVQVTSTYDMLFSTKKQKEREQWLNDIHAMGMGTWITVMKFLLDSRRDIDKELKLRLPPSLVQYSGSIADGVVMIPPALVLFIVWNYLINAICYCLCPCLCKNQRLLSGGDDDDEVYRAMQQEQQQEEEDEEEEESEEDDNSEVNNNNNVDSPPTKVTKNGNDDNGNDDNDNDNDPKELIRELPSILKEKRVYDNNQRQNNNDQDDEDDDVSEDGGDDVFTTPNANEIGGGNMATTTTTTSSSNTHVIFSNEPPAVIPVAKRKSTRNKGKNAVNYKS
jgi:hypothetical protein